MNQEVATEEYKQGVRDAKTKIKLKIMQAIERLLYNKCLSCSSVEVCQDCDRIKCRKVYFDLLVNVFELENY